MQHFYVVTFTKKRKFITLFAIGLSVILFFVFKPLSPYSFFIQSEQTALTKGDQNQNALALTFNISWGDEKVVDILDTLRKENVRATFFVSGEWAERHPQLLEKIRKDKHELGMLGYRYENYIDMEIGQIKKDIQYAKEIFKKQGLEDIRYIRPPDGEFSKEIIDLVEEMDLEAIHWSVQTNDAENPGVETLEGNITKATKGDIILLHASDSAKQTAEALQGAIPKLQQKDMTFSTISELSHGITVKEKLIE